MPDNFAISIANVNKQYRLYDNQFDQLVDALNLKFLKFLGSRSQPRLFSALSDITLDVEKGQRIGIIGRNGAGKTTLLKLICGNFAPTSGTIHINGSVQALLSTGIGFHPDFTGRENIISSLHYNGLTGKEHTDAVEDIIEFCELGVFLDQPFKTYSLGMQARLMFAAATAIHPEILIVDEVLGAGDAYFVAKSRKRVLGMISCGCTMLLVSHSMPQILEMCETTIWLDSGSIRMIGPSFEVVKEYERSIHGNKSNILSQSSLQESTDLKETNNLAVAIDRSYQRLESLQVPVLELKTASIPLTLNKYSFLASGGLQRWDSEDGPKFIGYTMFCDGVETNNTYPLSQVEFLFGIHSRHDRPIDCRYGILINDMFGRAMSVIYSDNHTLEPTHDGMYTIKALIESLTLGPGEYTVGLSLLSDTPLENINSAVRYDLLSRSFSLRVKIPETLQHLSCLAFQSSSWTSYNSKN